MRRILQTILLVFFIANYAFSQSITTIPGPQLSEARVGLEMQPLPDGKMLVIGGDNGYLGNYIFYKSCQIYNPFTNKMEAAPDMHVPRRDFMSEVLNDGNILVMGGNNFNTYGVLSCEIYNHVSNKWEFTDSLKSSHWGGASVRLNDGRILVAGGINSKTEVFDPSTKKWSYLGDMTVIHGTGMSLTLLKDGTVLAVGGSSNGKAIERFSPVTNTWASAGTANNNRQDHLATLLPNGNVLIAGSSFFSSADQLSSEIYYTYGGFSNITGKLLYNISGAKGLNLENGKVLTFGIGDVFALNNTKIFQEYDVALGKWTTSPYSSIGASYYAMGYLPSGDIFIAGGNFTTGNGANNGTIIVKQSGYTSCVTPVTNLDVSVAANSCYGNTISTVKINTLEIGVNYNLLVGGREVGSGSSSGTPIEFSIYGKDLSVGSNLISFKIKKTGCVSMYSNSFPLVLELKNPNIPTISQQSGSVLLCPSSPKAVLQIDPPLSGTYIWSNNATTNTIEITNSGVLSTRNVNSNGCWSLPSNALEIRKITSSDVKAGTDTTLCQSSTNLQLKSFPAGGTWSGTGVSSSGVFSPAISNVGNFTLTYNFCDFTASKRVNVEVVNTINYAASNIIWPTTDTLCGGVNYAINLANFNSSYRYRVYANDKLINTLYNSNSATYFRPDSLPVTNFVFKIDRAYPSQTCVMDSLTIKKTINVWPIPRKSSVLVPDTGCFGSEVPIKIIKPTKGAYYYAAYNPVVQLDNQGVKAKALNSDSVQIFSPKYFRETGTLYHAIIGIPSLSCTTATVYLKEKYVLAFQKSTAVGLGNVYYTGEKIAPQTISNMNYFQWNIDNALFNTKNPPEKTYSTVGKHTYQLISKSKHACSDTLKKEISIVRKPSLASTNVCLFDSSLVTSQQAHIFKTIVDKKDNTIYAGMKFVDYSGGYSGSENAILEKFSKTGGKAIWRLAHSPYYAANYFYSMYITGVTVDENNDIYITGGYYSSQLQFAGITMLHPESSNPYGHTYVAKISEAGKLLWFISSYIPNFSDRGAETGGSDIKYSNGKLYVAARLLSQKDWKNQNGQNVLVENASLAMDYGIMEVSTDGSKVKLLASIGNDGRTNTLYGMQTMSSSYYHSAKIPILGPSIHVLADGRLAVYGAVRSAELFGNETKTPFIFPSLSYNNYAEFTGIINPAKTGWESFSFESTTNSPNSIQLDKVIPLAVYTSNMDKISILNIGQYFTTNPVDYTIRINATESLTYNQNAALIKSMDKNGTLLWKRLLKGAIIQNLQISSDSSQIIVIGSLKNGMTIDYGNTDNGLNTTLNRDLFAMGFNTKTGNLVWGEKIGSNTIDDFYFASTLSPCNDLILLGYQSLNYTYDRLDTVRREQSQLIHNSSSHPYLIRLPLTGMCNATSCKLVTELDDQTIVFNQQVIYPNPTHSEFIIKPVLGDVCESATLRDLGGKPLMTVRFSGQGETKIDVSAFSSGVYLLETIGKLGRSVNKVSIIK